MMRGLSEKPVVGLFCSTLGPSGPAVPRGFPESGFHGSGRHLAGTGHS